MATPNKNGKLNMPNREHNETCFTFLFLTITSIYLTDENLGLLSELVRGDLQVKGRGSLTDATAGIVVRTVARAEPTVVLAGVTDGDAAQVGADAKNDEPLGLEGAVLVGLLIA